MTKIFVDVNRLTVTMKMAFLKSPNCRANYEEGCPNILFLPEPVLTCWGLGLWQPVSTLSSSLASRRLSTTFNLDEAKNIREAQELLSRDTLAADLSYINANLVFLAGAVTQLEEASLSLTHSLSILADAKKLLNSLTGPKGKILKEKWCWCWRRTLL